MAAGAAATIENLIARVRAWWVMVLLLALAFTIGKTGVILLFAFASFAGLREFLTLTSRIVTLTETARPLVPCSPKLGARRWVRFAFPNPELPATDVQSISQQPKLTMRRDPRGPGAADSDR